MWGLFFWISVFFTILITGLAIFFVVRYRSTAQHRQVNASADHNLTLELTWTLIPLIIVMVIFGLGFKYYMNMDTPPADAYNIGVQAQQWSWTFSYPNGAVTNKLYLPLNRPVKFSMTSTDVLHGFWIPNLSMQKDIVPGRVMTLWVKPTRAGRYVLQCAEYCGSGHSSMLAPVIVEPWTKFQASIAAAANIWANQGRPLAMSAVGARLAVMLGCEGCHSVNGSAGEGPTWKNLAGSQVTLANGRVVTATYAYLEQAILYPGRKMVKGYPDIMPNHDAELAGPAHPNHRKLNALIWYINSLSRLSNRASEPPVPNQPTSTVARAKSGLSRVAPPAEQRPGRVGVKATVTATKAAPLLALGEKLYQAMGCDACHTVNGQPGAGPTWKNLAGYPQQLTNGQTKIADTVFLKYMILHPGKLVVKGFPPIMPDIYYSRLAGPKHPREKKLKAIIAYIESLSDRGAKGAVK